MILAIDIGLKNLAMCAMSCTNKKDFKTYDIKLWDVYNTLNEESANVKCGATLKSGKVCDKRCGFKYTRSNIHGDETVHCCKTHFPKTIKLEKGKHVIKEKKVADYLLQDIARIVLSKIREIFDTNHSVMDEVTKVIIELQPKVNNKMKLISHLIYGKFVELFLDKPKVTVRFVRASQKLKAYTGPTVECKLKGAYAKRKYLAVQYTSWFLTNKFDDNSCSPWLAKFNTSVKRDDLSDTFLMAINGLQ